MGHTFTIDEPMVWMEKDTIDDIQRIFNAQIKAVHGWQCFEHAIKNAQKEGLKHGLFDFDGGLNIALKEMSDTISNLKARMKETEAEAERRGGWRKE